MIVKFHRSLNIVSAALCCGCYGLNSTLAVHQIEFKNHHFSHKNHIFNVKPQCPSFLHTQYSVFVVSLSDIHIHASYITHIHTHSQTCMYIQI